MCMNIILPNPKLCRRHGIWDCGEHGARQATSITGLATGNAGSAWFESWVYHSNDWNEGSPKYKSGYTISVQATKAIRALR